MTQQKLPPMYSLTAIGIATFLGSALAAGYMLASNYRALGRRQLGIYAIWGSAAIVLGMLLIPTQLVNNMTVASIAMIGQVLLVLFIANKLQGAMFSSFEDMGGTYHPMWRAVVVGIIASFVLTVIWVASIILLGIEPPAPPAP